MPTIGWPSLTTAVPAPRPPLPKKDAQTNAHEMQAQFGPTAMLHQPAQHQPRAQQHAAGAAQPADITPQRPRRPPGAQAHGRRDQQGQPQAHAVETVAPTHIVQPSHGQRAAHVTGVVDGRQRPSRRIAQTSLGLHDRQQGRVGKTGQAQSQHQATNATGNHLPGLQVSL